VNPILKTSETDSLRFGIEVFRGYVQCDQVQQVVTEIKSSACDLAILRTPAGEGLLAVALQKSGLPFLQCDTLVYYEIDLESFTPKPLRNQELVMRRAKPEDRNRLLKLIEETFSGYRSHYNNNPLLDSAAILEGYKEWGASFLDASDRPLWVAERDGIIIAFAACAANKASGESEGVLYGVAPEASGGGIYGDLIRRTQASFKSEGYARMTVSTQIWNYAVQKVWVREGFVMSRAVDTFHVNAMLSSRHIAHSCMKTFSNREVQAFAELSGDSNPIHISPSAAQAAGFPSTIAHGVLGAGEVSRILGMDEPGNGTILKHLNLSFLKPLIVDEPHRIDTRYVSEKRLSGSMKLISRIFDASNALCMIARADVVVRR